MIAIWLLRLIVIYLVVRGLSRLFRGVQDGMHAPRDGQPPAVPLARDPICGTFVVPSRALTSGSGADTRFFCSEKCRRAYALKRTSHASAGGKPPQAAASAQRDGERKRGPIERSQ